MCWSIKKKTQAWTPATKEKEKEITLRITYAAKAEIVCPRYRCPTTGHTVFLFCFRVKG